MVSYNRNLPAGDLQAAGISQLTGDHLEPKFINSLRASASLVLISSVDISESLQFSYALSRTLVYVTTTLVLMENLYEA